MGDVPGQEDESTQRRVDDIVGEKSAKASFSGEEAFRCSFPAMACTNFHTDSHLYPHNYNARIDHRDDSVFICEGLVHKISHYTSSGELIGAYGVELRYPKRLELHPDGSFYFANTNRHRIERVASREYALQGKTYNTFGNAIASVPVGVDLTNDEEYQWPMAVKYFAEQWWVISMNNGMRRGRLFRFDRDGKFLD